MSLADQETNGIDSTRWQQAGAEKMNLTNNKR